MEGKTLSCEGRELIFMCSFIFTDIAIGNGNESNPIDARSLNGYEYMRMTSSPTQNNIPETQ